ncbi:MAG: hypothetical protein OEY59_07540, partial [Deltaproteobacteria bacterium]|nr:hypothetical protein [Deltaproteobacteria bacterium]
INDAVAKILKGEDINELKIKEAKRVKYRTWFFSSLRVTTILLGILLILGGIGAGGLYVYQSGIYLEYTNPSEYGTLRVVAKIPKKDKELEDIFLKATLHFEGKDRVYAKQVRGIKLEFNADQEKESKDNFSLKSQKIILKSGKYLLVANFENEKYYQNFFLWPKIVQKRNLETKDSRVLSVTLNNAPVRLPLKVDFKVWNRLDNKDITQTSDFFVRYDKYGDWLKWSEFVRQDKDLIEKKITTGRKYRFKITNDGYQEKHHSVYVGTYQTTLNLNVEMEPVSGNLFMKSDYVGLDVLINNSSYYSTGGTNVKFKKLDSLTLKTSKTVLPSGTYFLTIKKEGFFSGGISKTRKITILPNKDTFISANYSEKDNTLDFEIEEQQ